MWYGVQVLRVRSCVAGSHAREVLRDGDMLLSVAGRPVSHFRAVEAAVAAYRPRAAASPGRYAATAAPHNQDAQQPPSKPPVETDTVSAAQLSSRDLSEIGSEGTVVQVSATSVPMKLQQSFARSGSS